MADDTVSLSETTAVSTAPVVSDTAALPPVVDTISEPVATPEIIAPVETPVVEPVKESTLLGVDKNAKPVESPVAPVVDAAKPEEGGEQVQEENTQSDETAQLPTYEAFTFPEGITFEDEKLGEFTKDLADFETLSKADHAEVQKFGQNLINRHVSEVQKTVQRLADSYTAQWEKQKSDWKDSFQKDPEIGGNRQETTVSAALEFIRTHGGSEDQQKEFRDLMETTGIGNHPAMIRLLAKANTNMAEGKPLPATTPIPQTTSKVAKRYGSTT